MARERELDMATGGKTEAKRLPSEGETAMLLRVAEVVKILGISRPTLYNWVAARKIPHLAINGRIRFDEAELRAWLDGQRVPSRTD
jgi:excisionase family DNA binding protein